MGNSVSNGIQFEVFEAKLSPQAMRHYYSGIVSRLGNNLMFFIKAYLQMKKGKNCEKRGSYKRNLKKKNKFRNF